MLDYRKINILSIVVVGDFNPIIFQPAWFAFKKLLGENECEAAKVEIIHKDLVRIKFDWFDLEVNQDRMQIISSKEAYFEPLKDLIESIFKLVHETPVRSFGLNHSGHFQLRTKDDFINFGNFLVPLDNWDEEFSDPRLLNLEVVDMKKSDGTNGNIRFTIQPSEEFKNDGIYTNFNNHFIVESKRTDEMITLLNDNWEKSFKKNDSLISKLWSKFKK